MAYKYDEVDAMIEAFKMDAEQDAKRKDIENEMLAALKRIAMVADFHMSEGHSERVRQGFKFVLGEARAAIAKAKCE